MTLNEASAISINWDGKVTGEEKSVYGAIIRNHLKMDPAKIISGRGELIGNDKTLIDVRKKLGELAALTKNIKLSRNMRALDSEIGIALAKRWKVSYESLSRALAYMMEHPKVKEPWKTGPRIATEPTVNRVFYEGFSPSAESRKAFAKGEAFVFLPTGAELKKGLSLVEKRLGPRTPAFGYSRKNTVLFRTGKPRKHEEPPEQFLECFQGLINIRKK